MLKQILFYLFFLLFIFPSGFAQSNSPYEIITLENGVFAININRFTGRVHYFLTDNDLTKTYEKTIDLPQNIFNSLIHTKDDQIYILFNWGSRGDYNKIFFNIDSNSGETESYQINTITAFFDDFRILENKVVFLSRIQGGNTYLQFENLDALGLNPLPLHLNHMVLDITASEGYLDILAMQKNPRGPDRLQLVTYSEDGEKMYAIDANIPSKEVPLINSVQFVEGATGKFKVVGTYSQSEKENPSGYFYWELDQTLSQNLRVYPNSSLPGFLEGKKGKLKRQVKYELTKGFQIVKIIEEDTNTTLVAIPNTRFKPKKYPRTYHHKIFHILQLDGEGQLLSDRTFALKGSLRSPHLTASFLNDPPIYSIDGDLLFIHNEEFVDRPNLIIQDLNQSLAQKATEILPERLREDVLSFNTKHWRDQEILVFGLRAQPENQTKVFFLEKMWID